MKLGKAVLVLLFSPYFWSCESPGRIQYLEAPLEKTAKNEAEKYEVEWVMEQEESLGTSQIDYTIKVVSEAQTPVELDTQYNGQELTTTWISQDLSTFKRFSPASSSGTYQGSLSGLLPGLYHLFSEFRPLDDRAQRHHTTFSLPGSTVQSNRTLDTTWVFRGENFYIEMNPEPPELQPGKTVELLFSLRDLETGPIIGELEPVEGRIALLFVVQGGQTMTAHSLRSPPVKRSSVREELSGPFTPSASGLHKVWLQFQWRGQIYTADFWINVPQ